MKKLFRASILYGDKIVKDRYFEDYDDAESWCYYQLDILCRLNPTFTDWYEAVIIQSEGVIF